MKKKKKKPKLDFCQKLAEKLRNIYKGEVTEGDVEDKEDRWVSLTIEGTELNFVFDGKGETIEKVGLYKDVIQVVGQDKIWGN